MVYRLGTPKYEKTLEHASYIATNICTKISIRGGERYTFDNISPNVCTVYTICVIICDTDLCFRILVLPTQSLFLSFSLSNYQSPYPVAMSLQLGLLRPVSVLPFFPQLHEAVAATGHKPRPIIQSINKLSNKSNN